MSLDDGGAFVHLLCYFLALVSYEACHKSTVATAWCFLCHNGLGYSRFWLGRGLLRRSGSFTSLLIGVGRPEPCNLGSLEVKEEKAIFNNFGFSDERMHGEGSVNSCVAGFIYEQDSQFRPFETT